MNDLISWRGHPRGDPCSPQASAPSVLKFSFDSLLFRPWTRAGRRGSKWVAYFTEKMRGDAR